MARATAHFDGHVNSLGLTRRGREMLEAMMARGMLIDVDHMSDKATDEALSLAEAHRYPLISSHATFRELAFDAAKADGRPAIKHALKHESSKTRRSIERIRALRGIVACQLNQGVVRDFDVSRVANDCAASSKSWAQAYLYALHHMGGSNVAIGTDFNGFAGACCPRYGSWAAFGLKDDPARRGQVDGQTAGVRYVGELQDYRAPRWDFDDTYTIQERDVWEAVAIGLSGADLDRLELRPLPLRMPGTNSWIVDVAKGVRAPSLDSIPQVTAFTQNLVGGYNFASVQRGAFLATRLDVDVGAIDDEGVREVAARVRPVFERFSAMRGPNPPITRSVAGRRDFDINVDGFAHYGLFPDFVQDLNNIGLGWDLLTPLFRSSEDFVRVWERCEQPQLAVSLEALDIDPSLAQRVEPMVIKPNDDAATIDPGSAKKSP